MINITSCRIVPIKLGIMSDQNQECPIKVSFPRDNVDQNFFLIFLSAVVALLLVLLCNWIYKQTCRGVLYSCNQTQVAKVVIERSSTYGTG